MKIFNHAETFGAHCAPANGADVPSIKPIEELVERPIGRRNFIGLFSTGSAMLLAGCGGGGGGSSMPAATTVPVTIPDATPAPPPPPPPPPPPAAEASTTPEATLTTTATYGPARVLQARPPVLTNAIVVDLRTMNPALPLPGWDGKIPSQKTTAMYPHDRDLLIIGHPTAIWTGGGFIRGGRNVHWIGGTFTRGPWLRNFMGDACMEGILTRAPFSVTGTESGDSFSINPDSKTMGTSRVIVLNCRGENIDGFFDGLHGDCFQLAAHYDAPSGYCAMPREVIIERFTGTTAYQGLFLPAQHFDAIENGYKVMIQSLTLRDVNLRKSRSQTILSTGVARGTPNLIFMVDMASNSRGDKPYPKTFRNVFVQPAGSEGLDGCIFPTSKTATINPVVGKQLKARISADGKSATYPPEMLLDGMIQLGTPPEGDFARAAGSDGRGGLDLPGMGYVSPGYA